MPKGTNAIADSGYVGIMDKVIIYRQEHSTEFKELRAKNRQESLHLRLKLFNVLKKCF